MSKNYTYGHHTVSIVLEKEPQRVRRLYVQQGLSGDKWLQLEQQARAHHISIERVQKATLDKWFSDANHQGIAADIQQKPVQTEADLEVFFQDKVRSFVLVLDGVQDPHNLGACLRTADAAGIDAVVIPKDKSAPVTSVVRKVSSGAAEVLPIFQVTNLKRVLAWFKTQGFWIYGLDVAADKMLYEENLTKPLVLVMGSEGQGLRQLTKKECDMLLKLPMLGQVESLNVSVATGICLYEIVRQSTLQKI